MITTRKWILSKINNCEEQYKHVAATVDCLQNSQSFSSFYPVFSICAFHWPCVAGAPPRGNPAWSKLITLGLHPSFYQPGHGSMLWFQLMTHQGNRRGFEESICSLLTKDTQQVDLSSICYCEWSLCYSGLLAYVYERV